MLSAIVAAVGLAVSGAAQSGVGSGDFVESRLKVPEAKFPSCLSRFLDYPPGPGKLGFPRCLFQNPFPENPDFWLKGVDFTCVSPWNDTYRNQRAGTAISKRHVIFAKHFPMSAGTRMAFVGETGETSHYTIKATRALEKCDIMIGLLDYELTPDVHPAKVLPADYTPWIEPGAIWPVVTFNQREQAYLSELHCMTNRPKGTCSALNRWSKKDTWRRFGGEIIGGDSGHPAFLICLGKPILIYCLLSGVSGNGPLIHEHRSEIQRAMDDLCPGYKLEDFDPEMHCAP